MLIFYMGVKNLILYPVVIIDAMSSDDRYSTAEINTSVKENAPEGSTLGIHKVYSCEYSAEFRHTGIPLGEGMKTRFSATLKSAPASLVMAMSPQFVNSSQSIEAMSNSLGTIANPEMIITYGAMVVKGVSGIPVSRQFIVYAAPVYPDPMGTNTVMVISGAKISDVLIKSEYACQIDRKTPLGVQLAQLLQAQSPVMIGNYDAAPQIEDLPATEILFPPMQLNDILDEICLQNKMIYKIEGSTVTFYSVAQEDAPEAAGYKPPEFSFLGYKGYIAWGLSVENYVNVSFKSAIFDPKLFGKISLYNDINSAFFGSMTKRSGAVSRFDLYDMWIIRYGIKWNRYESVCEVTATNNWLMSQFRIDGILETKVYEQGIQ
jgi:hypothetical protein